ncbi:MAG: PHP domain-containing protein [Nanoarchaeota archaeon]|nr:PHP domain-containing protein [Nanoarchaeota archaeon]
MMKNFSLKKMDMHVHTRFSTEELDLGVMKITVNMAGDPVSMYKKAKALGMDFVTFTDHNTIDGCLYLKERMPHVDDFVISEEITTFDPKYKFVIHINAYNITKLQHRRISKLREDFPKLTKYLKQQKILYSYNHPYWHRYYDYIATMPKPMQRVYEIAKNFKIIEGSNSFRLKKQNQMAKDMAQALKLGTIAGSDCHGESIGRAYTLAKADSIKGFLKEVRAGRTLIKEKNYAFKDFYQECMNIFYINTKKIREEYPSREIRAITKLIHPVAKFFIRRYIRKNMRIQKRIIRDMKK